MKVYCKKCKWLFWTDSEYACCYYCEHPNNKAIKRNAFTEYRTNKLKPEEKNARNNCYDFEERISLWRRLKNFVLASFR